jgi:2-haloacid dehalogenase
MSPEPARESTLGISGIKALTFDVFGTIVDWRTSISEEGRRLGEAKGIKADWVAFADAWRGGYTPAMDSVRSGDLPWTNIDGLHRIILDEILGEFGIDGLSEEDRDEFNRAWHRLDPWPDVVSGLGRLKTDFLIAPLSNGNVALLTNMAKRAGLVWDCVLSAELSGHYKPDPEVYIKGAQLLGLRAEQVMMVAAHTFDLRAAQAVGMRAAYVFRPLEFGPEAISEQPDLEEFDVYATDFLDLAMQLES